MYCSFLLTFFLLLVPHSRRERTNYYAIWSPHPWAHLFVWVGFFLFLSAFFLVVPQPRRERTNNFDIWPRYPWAHFFFKLFKFFGRTSLSGRRRKLLWHLIIASLGPSFFVGWFSFGRISVLEKRRQLPWHLITAVFGSFFSRFFFWHTLVLGRRRELLSSDYAYGDHGIPGLIPTNATLYLEVTLIAIHWLRERERKREREREGEREGERERGRKRERERERCSLFHTHILLQRSWHSWADACYRSDRRQRELEREREREATCCSKSPCFLSPECVCVCKRERERKRREREREREMYIYIYIYINWLLWSLIIVYKSFSAK